MAVSKLLPKARYTNNDVIDAVREVHSCLHTVEGKVDDIRTHVEDAKQRLARVEGYQSGMATKLGVAPNTPPPTFVQKHKTPLVSAGAALGVLASFVAVYPLLRAVGLAIDAYMTVGPK